MFETDTHCNLDINLSANAVSQFYILFQTPYPSDDI